jgi:hypothetical protein
LVRQPPSGLECGAIAVLTRCQQTAKRFPKVTAGQGTARPGRYEHEGKPMKRIRLIAVAVAVSLASMSGLAASLPAVGAASSAACA